MSCDGTCCTVFTYPRTPEELREKPWEHYPSQADAHYIADMLIPLTTEEAQERRAIFGGSEIADDSTTPFYTCKHWNEDTRLCNNYEDRPQMCAEYPYTKTCDSCGFENTSDLIAIIERRQLDEGFKTHLQITLGEN